MNDKINKKCEHKNVRKEIFLGTKTGDWICCECGETFQYKPEKRADN